MDLVQEWKRFATVHKWIHPPSEQLGPNPAAATKALAHWNLRKAVQFIQVVGRPAVADLAVVKAKHPVANNPMSLADWGGRWCN